jgi:hypothetical protein
MPPESMTKEIDEREVWDFELAQRLPGLLLLVGLAYFDSDDTLIEQKQFFGRVFQRMSAKGTGRNHKALKTLPTAASARSNYGPRLL